MKLYSVHCGYYDNEVCSGTYEFHVNYFVAAESFELARAKAKQLPEYKLKRMHVDGIEEIEVVDGMRVTLLEDPSYVGKTLVTNHRHRDLAPSQPKDI